MEVVSSNKLITFLDNKRQYESFPRIPDVVKDNLSPKFHLRGYQEEAIQRLIYYLENDKVRQRPTQLLFHMATGSGKTLVMAAAILLLYKRGYRNFVFFVNSSNIIQKTKENFINASSSKFLFSNELNYMSKRIRIREIDNFESSNYGEINIKFTTIQGLHYTLNNPSENSMSFDDFIEKDTVLISDEAHHINADTKKKNELNQGEKKDKEGWEGTVDRIFRSNPLNILLEFTATANLNHSNVEQKYFDKLLYDYPLKQFRKDGYSKDVKVLQADIDNKQRALQACLLSQYRRKVFEKYRQHIKPIILFKSKSIKESKSFIIEFVRLVKNLDVEQVIDIKESTSEPILITMFNYFKRNGIPLENIVQEIKVDFSEEKLIEVNSKSEVEKKQIAINTLEDEDNEYRAVFAVDMLNEGWDVLNLFDIVRLYNSRDKNTKTGEFGKTTISEAQLIGRGARYYPFKIEEEQPMFKRKYDDEPDNELRIGEELYYHSAYNPKYISELNDALREIGIKPNIYKEVNLKLKPDFKETDLYKNGYIFLNERVPNNRIDIFHLPSSIKKTTYKYRLKTGYSKSISIFESDDSGDKKIKRVEYDIISFGSRIIRKALDKLDFFQFNNLKSYLPNLKSKTEFIHSENYLSGVKVEVEGTENQFFNLPPEEKLNITIFVLLNVAEEIKSNDFEYKGTKRFRPYPIKKVFKDKKLTFTKNDEGLGKGIGISELLSSDMRLDLSSRDWYAFDDDYGTSEEKYFVRFIEDNIEALSEKFDVIYLLRNESHFKIYNFDDGRAFEPDYILCLKKKDHSYTTYYQVFIEPKGQHLEDKDRWKENFLKHIKENYEIAELWKNKNYTLWGMPFYRESNKNEFSEQFNNLLEE
ncbi:DEAD/DEAH box helicase family protein [Virgibacillus natechei]